MQTAGNSYLSSDYSLGLVTWQQTMCAACNTQLDIHGITVVELHCDSKAFYHFYCYNSLRQIKISVGWIKHIDRGVPEKKVQAFVFRQHLLVNDACFLNLRKYEPKLDRGSHACPNLIEVLKFLPIEELISSVTRVSRLWYAQCWRDELWLEYIEQMWPCQDLGRREGNEPLKLLYLRIFTMTCADCKSKVDSNNLGMKCPIRKQPVCLTCSGNPAYTLASFKLLSNSYYISTAGLKLANVQTVITIRGMSFAFAGQAHNVILDFRKRRQKELIRYLRGVHAPLARLISLESLDVDSKFPRFLNQFEKRMQGYIYCQSRHAEDSVPEYLARLSIKY